MPAPPPIDDRPAAAPAGTARTRPGQLTMPWRVATVAMWTFVFVAMAGVWKASQELGLATWWLGPFSSPNPFFVILVPFYAPTVVIVTALNNGRRVPWVGLTASAVTAAIGVVDLGGVTRLGLVELALGGAGAVFSVTSLTGTYRRP